MSFSDYLADFRAQWRALAAASFGLGSGMALAPFAMNVLAPHLVHAMGWSHAAFAMVAVVSGLAILTYPIVGALADHFGARPIAVVGVTATALSYMAIAAMNGPLGVYAAILVLQITLGVMTTGPVLLRIIVRAFDRSRGAAMAIAVATPAVIAAVGSPLLAAVIDAQGWRFAAVCLAVYTFATGLLAAALIPKKQTPASRAPRSTVGFGSLRGLIANPDFRILIGATLLVSMPIIVMQSQLSLVVIENGLSAANAGSIISLFAIGTIVGRLLGGLALDTFAAETVGAITFSLPALGFVLLASPFDHTLIIASAVLVLGLAFGAEGDVLAYIVGRLFALETYGLALGAVFATVGAATMLGALALSETLRLWNSYGGFLLIASLLAFCGSLLLLRLRSALNPVSRYSALTVDEEA